MPAVSFLKAAEYQDGHAGYSDPIDEQNFLVNTINADPEVAGTGQSTAIVIAYDDSDGWYDHQVVHDRERLERPHGRRHRDVHLGAMTARRHHGPLRPRPAAAAAGHLAWTQDELRRPHTDRPGLGA